VVDIRERINLVMTDGILFVCGADWRWRGAAQGKIWRIFVSPQTRTSLTSSLNVDDIHKHGHR